MKQIFKKISSLARNQQRDELTTAISPDATIIGSWRLTLCFDSQDVKHTPRWKEVWSFAALDSDETNGIYACDYINLHTIIGKWQLAENRLKLIRKEYEFEYAIYGHTDDELVLKTEIGCEYNTLVFQRVV